MREKKKGGGARERENEETGSGEAPLLLFRDQAVGLRALFSSYLVPARALSLVAYLDL